MYKLLLQIKHGWNENSHVSVQHIYHSLQAFGGHHLHYQVHINTNRKLFARID